MQGSSFGFLHCEITYVKKNKSGIFNVYTGSKPGFYQWSRGVCMQANLDLLLDWAQSNGLGEVAVEHTHTLSSAINLLATPRKHLLQVTQKFMHSDTLDIYPYSDRIDRVFGISVVYKNLCYMCRCLGYH